MKTLLKAATVLSLVALFAACLAGCKPKESDYEFVSPFDAENYQPMDYTDGYTVVEGMDCYDTMKEVYDNWAADRHYDREEYFTFTANDGDIATQENWSVFKMNGNEVFRESITVGQRLGEEHLAMRFYSDGSKHWQRDIDDKKIVPGYSDSNVTADTLFTVKDWGSYSEWNGDDDYPTIEDKLYTYQRHMTTYRLFDEGRDCLAEENDDNVYEKDGRYFFTITIDCSKEKMDSLHTAARDEFLDSTGGDKGSLVMTNNTTIDFCAKEIDGKLKVVGWRRTERYYGKLGFLKVECRQTCTSHFFYDEDDYTITSDEKMNLA